jgi:hypothetical protein
MDFALIIDELSENVTKRIMQYVIECIIRDIYETYTPRKYVRTHTLDNRSLESLHIVSGNYAQYIVEFFGMHPTKDGERTLPVRGVAQKVNDQSYLNRNKWEIEHQPFWDNCIHELDGGLFDVFVREEIKKLGLTLE